MFHTKVADKCPYKNSDATFLEALVINPKWRRATHSAFGEWKLTWYIHTMEHYKVETKEQMFTVQPGQAQNCSTERGKEANHRSSYTGSFVVVWDWEWDLGMIPQEQEVMKKF